MCFADMIVGPQESLWFNVMGYALIIVVSANLIINFGYILGKSIKANCRKYRIKYLVWRRKKLRESLKRKRELWEAEQLRIAKSNEPLTPRSLKLWHQLRKDLGMSYDSQFIQEYSYSFNSEADLLRLPPKESELILERTEDKQRHGRRQLNAELENYVNEPEPGEVTAATKRRAEQK